MPDMYVQRAFRDLRSIGLAPTLENMEFVKCEFRNCVLATDDDPEHRAVLKNIMLKDSRVTSSSVSGAILQDCVLENVAWDRLLIVYGCAFEHVTLRGRVRRLWLRNLSPVLDPVSHKMNYSMVQAFDEANAKSYESIDWALDIREVVTQELQIDGIPAHLIRRDPERHVVFRRVKALDGRWQDYDLHGTGAGLHILLKELAESGPEAKLFVIPDTHPQRERTVALVKELRAAGIAEPD